MPSIPKLQGTSIASSKAIFVHLLNEDFDTAFGKLKFFHNRYKKHFRTKTRNAVKTALHYLYGKLLQKGRGNMVQYAKYVPNCNNQQLQHFITNSSWNERAVIAQLQTDVAQLIGDKDNGALHIDEVAFNKDGKDSVGVQRQYCGRLGKIENCQVGVFLGYTKGSYRTLIDERLYLPIDWINDRKRRKKCGVPEDIEFKTKADLGWEMILEAKGRGVPFGWVGMDCFYGQQAELRNKIDSEGLIYIADIPCDTRVWLNRPRTEVRKKKGRRGRQPTIERIAENEAKPIEVQKLKDELDSSAYQRVFLRDTERGELWCSLACIRVFPVENTLPGKEQWLLIRREEGKKSKYQLSNAPIDTNIERLGQLSCSRYWIERAIEDAKGEVGLADYEVRSWRSWHHHMVMTLLAQLFLLILLLELGERAPLLTVQDVKEILELILPQKEFDNEAIRKLLESKHRARYSAWQSRHRKTINH